MTASRRTRPDRVRAAVDIALLALQQAQDELAADDTDRQELAGGLLELIEDIDVPGGLIPALAQLLAAAGARAEQIEPDRDGDASCPLHEAAELLTDEVGPRLIRAAHALNPQGEPA
ncbi:hypothetical protein ACTWJ8_40210 (plasmid) [Streptomyces sp. SDT5-1]|uniref:hypothetical protein n=1 Tax=Streptomyces sp. SDT5-1 TaxID=3406418 RepID=UPI003FD39819